MERTVNRVELRGNVGADPKITPINPNTNLIRFSLATHESYRTKDGTLKEETTWHNIVAWDSKNRGEFAKIKKGTFVEVVGKLRYFKYVTKMGEERYSTEIIALKLAIPEMLPRESRGAQSSLPSTAQSCILGGSEEGELESEQDLA